MTSALSTLGRGGPLGGVTVCFWGPLHLPQVTLTLSPSPSPSSSPIPSRRRSPSPSPSPGPSLSPHPNPNQYAEVALQQIVKKMKDREAMADYD